MPIDLQFFLNRSVIRWRPLSQTMAIGHWISCACCVRIARHDRALMSESDCVQSSLAVFLEKRALPLQKCDVVLRKRMWPRQQLVFLLPPHTNISIAQTSFFPVTTRGRIVAFLSCLLKLLARVLQVMDSVLSLLLQTVLIPGRFVISLLLLLR